MSGANTYRPRAAAMLKLPVLGSGADKVAQLASSTTIDLPLRIQRLSWLRNDANHADEARVTVEWYDGGVDPRYMANGVLSLWIGQADDRGVWTPSDNDLRFIGIISRPQRASAADGRLTVEIEAIDLTTLFIRTKPYRTVGIPSLTMSLSDAWRLICDNTGFYDHDQGKFVSTVQSLRDRIRFVGGASDVQIGTAVPQRFRGLAKVQAKPDADAWAVWQQCVGMLGLISYIDRGDCIVTTALDFYSAQNPARLIYGSDSRGILEHSEVRNCVRNAIGVGLTSFDPISGKTIEAFYPPLGSQQLTKAKARGKHKHALPEGSILASQYQVFPYPGITDPDLLQFAARRVFEEFSRQDMEGTVSTAEMMLPRLDGTLVDALSLKPGDAIRVEFDDQLKSALLGLSSRTERIAYLTTAGYSPATADLMVSNVQDIAQLQPECSVKTVGVDFEASNDGGQFRIQINYNARVQITGDTEAT